ncbi:anaphase-promoting complex subunit 2 [Anaeramoeba flamelloides]|uniref:Anaphase-promoting complex subunit 2 n=1 Tax=Anaeramoeba flamelloides TaxID=1746091 RepID=A0ABQ8YNS9_9EUKA|nr:anaphase-promoting complex subunit 2 [Anaeramoeba flamelloides]
MESELAWKTLLSVTKPLPEKGGLIKSIITLTTKGYLTSFLIYYQETIEQILRFKTIPLLVPSNLEQVLGLTQVLQTLDDCLAVPRYVFTELRSYQVANKLSKSPTAEMVLKGVLYSEKSFAKKLVASIGHLIKENLLEETQPEGFDRLCDLLIKLDFDPLIQKYAYQCYLGKLRDRLNTEIKGVYDETSLSDCEDWIKTFVLERFAMVYKHNETRLEKIKVELVQQLMSQYENLRISELFDIIIMYPESIPALTDLRLCISHSNGYVRLAKSLCLSFQNRLLHQGVQTQDILGQLFSAIRSLSHVDPSGTCVSLSIQPILNYLKTRKDTAYCAVENMMTFPKQNENEEEEIEKGELYEELELSLKFGSKHGLARDSLITRENEFDDYDDYFSDQEDDDEELDFENDLEKKKIWKPIQRVSQLSLVVQPTQSKNLDLISYIIQIYKSKEPILSQFKTIMANKLLNSIAQPADEFIQILEMMKIRFGEKHFKHCQIMLKDVADSRRFSTNINERIKNSTKVEDQNENDKETETETETEKEKEKEKGKEMGKEKNNDQIVIEPLIISQLYWPELNEEKFVDNYTRAGKSKERFANEFSVLKKPRKLLWKHSIGLVDLELEIVGQETPIKFKVNPLLATIILLFEEKEEWKIEEILEKIEIDENVLKNKIYFWVKNGVLRFNEETNLVSLIVEKDEQQSQNSRLEFIPEDESESQNNATSSLEKQQRAEEEVHKQFIINMLTNLGQLAFDNIYDMLKMFVQDPPFDRTKEQFQDFLDRLVTQDLLEFGSGVYTLKK